MFHTTIIPNYYIAIIEAQAWWDMRKIDQITKVYFSAKLTSNISWKRTALNIFERLYWTVTIIFFSMWIIDAKHKQ